VKFIIYQFLIIILLLLKPFNSVTIFILCNVLLFLALKKFNPLNPILWLLLSWNILFINAFSGVIIFNIDIDIIEPIIICLSIILTFFLGYSINLGNFKQIYQTSILIFHDFFVKKVLSKKLHYITYIFSIFAIIGAILFIIEIVFIYNGNLFEPMELRDIFHERDVTLLSQLSAIFAFGGLFSVSAFIFLSKSKYRTVYLIGTIALTVGSLLSAGRQMIFQLIMSSLFCFSILRFYKINLSISKIHKYIFGTVIVLIISFFVFISTARDLVSDKSKAEVYSSLNTSSYSDDFLNTLSFFPSYIEDFFVDYTFYFSHEIFLFSEWWHENEIQVIDYSVLRFSPFIERIVDRFGLPFETQAERIIRFKNFNSKGSIIPQGWRTTNASLFGNLGYLGSYLLVFFHGFFSKKLYIKCLTRPNFGLLNLSIANNLILIYTISNSVFSETQVLFYIIVSFLLINKNI